jgi:hypothetical protein
LPWKSLVPGLVLSLWVHVVLLWGLRVRREAPAPRPVLLLCFDALGQFDVSSGECWKPQPAPAR